MIVCIDTNIVVQARKPGHRFFPIMDAVVTGRLQWAVSNAILLEYREVILQLAGEVAWQKLARLTEYLLTTEAMLHISPQFQFRVISHDPDDNAFTDCAISANADFVITEDRHFAPLANAGYKPQPISPLEFIARHQDLWA